MPSGAAWRSDLAIRRADDRHTFGLGYLDDRRADGAGGGRDEDDVAFFRRRHVEQAEIGRGSRHSQHAEERLRLDAEIRHLCQRLGGKHGFVAPAGEMADQVARREGVAPAFDDYAERSAVHRRVQRERRDVGFGIVHPPAHVRIDREPQVAHPHHAVVERRRRDLLQLEIGRCRHSLRAVLEVPGARHLPSSLAKKDPARKGMPGRVGSASWGRLSSLPL